eukprot:1301159-Rhodomonas_salina.2
MVETGVGVGASGGECGGGGGGDEDDHDTDIVVSARVSLRVLHVRNVLVGVLQKRAKDILQREGGIAD